LVRGYGDCFDLDMSAARTTARGSKGGKKASGRKAGKRIRGGKTAKKRARQAGGHKWSARVTQRSDALDLQPAIFSSDSPRRIARSLKRSAERSTRRKGTPYQSAMSMLNFYINRGGRNLPQRRKSILERAKPELRKAFGRPP
jgi:Protein of unknown function (DUF3175)